LWDHPPSEYGEWRDFTVQMEIWTASGVIAGADSVSYRELLLSWAVAWLEDNETVPENAAQRRTQLRVVA
jgi:hypothetical protein